MKQFFANDGDLDALPSGCHQLAKCLGPDAFDRLVAQYGGQNLYIPKVETLCRASRDRQIAAQFTGRNFRVLAQKFCLSERQIRKIVKKAADV